MRISLMPPITVGAMHRGRVCHADAPRGCALHDTVMVDLDDGSRAEVSGAQLRTVLLAVAHPGPWELSFIGARRHALQLDPDGRSSGMAHLDALGLSRPKYWLYRRGDTGPVYLTRWIRLGHITRHALLEQAEMDMPASSKAAVQNAFDALVAEGLPATLELTHTRQEHAHAEAAEGGWLDIPPGGLNANPDRIPVDHVDDLGEWPHP